MQWLIYLSAYSGFEILLFIASTVLAVLLFGCLVVWLLIDKMSLIFGYLLLQSQLLGHFRSCCFSKHCPKGPRSCDCWYFWIWLWAWRLVSLQVVCWLVIQWKSVFFWICCVGYMFLDLFRLLFTNVAAQQYFGWVLVWLVVKLHCIGV